MIDRFFHDIRYAARGLRKAPAFTVVVVLMLALGIGANTAMFTVIRAVLLKPLNYADPDTLVELGGGASMIRFEETRAAAKSYSDVGAYLQQLEDVTLSGGVEPEVLKQARVSANALDILGVKPAVGRRFLPAEDAEGAPAVAMISHGLWLRRFAGDPQVAGKTAIVGGTAHTIVGVLPAGFQFPQTGIDLWVTHPSEVQAVQPQSRRISPILTMFARLKPGVSIAQATAEYAVLRKQFTAAHAEMLDARYTAAEANVALMKDQLVVSVRSLLWMLFGAVGFVLLIACANIASLLMARANSRSREFAVRAALGAGRGQLIAQLLAESLPLALIGGLLGALLAQWSLLGMSRMTALALPRFSETHIDGMVLLFALGVSLLTGVLFGMVPAFGASRPNLTGALRATGATSSSAGRTWFGWINVRSLLVVGQVALSVVLLIGAGLLMQSLAQLYRIDLGFRTDNLLTMRLSLAPTRYDTPEKRSAFFENLTHRVDAIPGAQGSGVSLTLPLAGYIGTPVQDASQPPLKLNERKIGTIQSVTPGYFKVMEIPLRRGREFDRRDRIDSPPTVVIDESTARQFWPQYPKGPDPIGRHLLIGINVKPIEIIGIVADIKNAREENAWPGLYRPALQAPPGSAAFVVRTSGDPFLLRKAIDAELRAIDPDQPVFEVKTMDDVAEAEVGKRRLILTLLGLFAGTALLLTLIGIYGVIAYSVTQRLTEIGIRRALGATPASILRLVMGQGLGLTLAGIALGIGGSLLLTQVMTGFLFQVSATDPTTYLATAVLFVLVALLAAYIPARRASRVDPTAALRMA